MSSLAFGLLLVVSACETIIADPIDRAWQEDPTSVPGLIQAIPDPVERIATVERLLAARPEHARILCPQLPAGPERRRCDQIAQRPHLWTERPPRPRQRSATGPASIRPLPQRWPPKTFDAQPGSPHAMDAASALARCRGLDRERRWQEECAFQAAEALMMARGVAAYPDAVALCHHAGSFQADCLAHLYPSLLQQVPAGSTAPADWAPLISAADRLHAHWASVDARFANIVVDQLWAEVTARAVDAAPENHGGLLDVLPATAAPHVRAAVALRWMQTRPPLTDLADAQHQLAAVLQRRPAPATATRPLNPHPIADLWPVDREEEGAIPAIAYLGQSRRAVSPNPTIDRQLVVLEAAARLRPPQILLLEDGARSEVAVVRWTARRLLERR